MAKIKVHAGDFLKGEGTCYFNTLNLKTKEHPWGGESISINELETVDIASEESVKKMAGSIGWGAVGALALGPLGLLAGVLAGGNKKEVTFMAKFKDGRKLLASTDNKTFIKLQAAAF